MKKNSEKLYKINKAKSRIKILDFVIIICAVITILLIFSSTYVCKGKIYERIIENGEESINQLIEINSKITFANMAFGIGENSESTNFVSVSKDIRFLFLYLAQIVAYGLVLFKLVNNTKVNFIMSILSSVVLLAVAISTISFMASYSNDLQVMFDQAIEPLKDINDNITSITDTNYPSRIFVEISPVPAISCAYMIISSIICVYTGFVKKGIKELESVKKINKRTIISLFINFIVSIIIFLSIFFARFKIDHFVIDAFSITGVAMLLYASMKFVISAGAFNVLGFWFKKFTDFFRRTPKYNFKYYDYIEMKKENEKPLLWPTIIIGCIYFVVGMIMIIVST